MSDSGRTLGDYDDPVPLGAIFVPDDPLLPVSAADLFTYLRRDLAYLDGVADTSGMKSLQDKVKAMRARINQLEKLVKSK